MKFLNTPWRVEREASAFVIVDAKNMIVAHLDCSEIEELPGTKEDEEKKAYGIAAMPEICAAASDFLAAMGDPVKQLDEDLLLACANSLEIALMKASPTTI